MRSISVKIFLVLVVISLIGALFTTIYIQVRTRNAFDTYIRDQNQQVLSDLLTDHYLEYSSWENVDEVFKTFYISGFPGNTGAGPQAGGGQGRNQNRPGDNQPLPPFVLVDPNGTIIAGVTNHPNYQIGDQISNKELKKSLALETEDTTAGYLAAVPISPNRSLMQQTFLNTVQQGLLISLGVTLTIALVLGGILVLSFTKPIRKLVDGTQRVASGDLGYQVNIQSSDELGKLADSFNSMSRDLKDADLSRKQMTADIAHDLRTPLSILHGYTEAMNEGKLDGSPDIYGVMHQQAQHLNFLIDDLRTLSLLDSEELDFQLQSIDPGNILTQVLNAFQPLAKEKKVQLELELPDSMPRAILDPDRLRQILGNLVSNALAVLESGGKIRIKTWERDGSLFIEVSDDGPGISTEDLPHIFDRHYRTDKSRSQAKGSSGLGLAITRKLIESQNGRIEVHSQIGKGTSFWVIFPTS
jgi:signal transduction histidine kinase